MLLNLSQTVLCVTQIVKLSSSHSNAMAQERQVKTCPEMQHLKVWETQGCSILHQVQYVPTYIM